MTAPVSESIKDTAPGVPPHRLAAGLLGADRNFVLVLYPLLALPLFVEEFADRFNPAFTFILPGSERAVELIFLFFLGFRWARKLRPQTDSMPRQPEPAHFPASAFARLFFTGFVLWALVIFPPALSLAGGRFQGFIFVALFLPGIILSYRYFMYFFPILFSPGGQSLAKSLDSAAQFVRNDLLLPLRVLAAPLGVSTFLSSLCAAPFPDGRDIYLSLLGDLFSPLLWILSCYLGLAFALLMLPDKEWREFNLDPYRHARIDTLSILSPGWLASILSFKSGIKFLIIAAFVWAGNQIRLEFMPPAGEITVKSVDVSGNTVTMNIEVTDPKYRLRAFRPVHLRLAGEKYLETGDSSALVAPFPEKVLSPEITDSPDLRIFIPPASKPVELTLIFKASRSGGQLTALQDLYLWYRHAKIANVRFAGN